MGSSTNANQRVLTGNQLVVDYDRQKIFRYNTEIVIGGTYVSQDDGPVTIAIGAVMGRVSASGNVVALRTDASDGSQFPIGLAADTITVDPMATYENFPIVDIGDVVEDLISLPGGDTLDDVIDGRRLRDRLAGDTRGINLIQVTQNSKFDN